MKTIGVILAALLSAAACRTGEPCGLPAATRCGGNAVEVCSGGGEWVPFLDCDQVFAQSGGEPWVCCAVEPDEGAPLQMGCVPAKSCVGGSLR